MIRSKKEKAAPEQKPGGKENLRPQIKSLKKELQNS
jgi:hypothetical protein